MIFLNVCIYTVSKRYKTYLNEVTIQGFYHHGLLIR